MEFYKLLILWFVSIAPSLFASFTTFKDFKDVKNQENGWGKSTELGKAVLNKVKLLGVSEKLFSRIICNTYCYNLRKEVILLTISGLFPIILSLIQLSVTEQDMDQTKFRLALGGLGVCGVLMISQIYFAMEFLKVSFEDFFEKYEHNSTGAFMQQVRFHFITIIVIMVVSILVIMMTVPTE